MRSSQEVIKIIKKLREAKKMSIEELAKRVGISKSTLSRYENQQRTFPINDIGKYADALNTTIFYLLGIKPSSKEINTEIPPLSDSREKKMKESHQSETRGGDTSKVSNLEVADTSLINETIKSQIIPVKASSIEFPLYGSISAGLPLEMTAIEEYIEIPTNLGEYYHDAFFLKVCGDSMNRIVPNGNYALISPSESVHSGDVVAVAINGCEATLKRFYQLQNTIVLEPDSYDASYTPQIFDCKKDECLQIHVLGKLVWHMAPPFCKY